MIFTPVEFISSSPVHYNPIVNHCYHSIVVEIDNPVNHTTFGFTLMPVTWQSFLTSGIGRSPMTDLDLEDGCLEIRHKYLSGTVKFMSIPKESVQHVNDVLTDALSIYYNPPILVLVYSDNLMPSITDRLVSRVANRVLIIRYNPGNDVFDAYVVIGDAKHPFEESHVIRIEKKDMFRMASIVCSVFEEDV
jgi:hypothetical protein